MLKQKDLKLRIDKIFQAAGIEKAEGKFHRFQSTISQFPLGVFIIVESDHYHISIPSWQDHRDNIYKVKDVKEVLNHIAKDAAPQIAFEWQEKAGADRKAFELKLSEVLTLMEKAIESA